MKITRRKLLATGGGLASGFALSVNASEVVTKSQDSQATRPRKIKVIVCGGHPGDPEYGCGGTIARLTELGHEVVLMHLNDGAWPPTPSTTRLAEAKKACEILKARPAYAGQVNGHAIVDNAHYEEFQKLIAAEKPDAVITHWPLDNHADHRAMTMLAYNVWHKVGQKFALYYYEVSDGEDTLQFSPNRYVDISTTESVKRAACYAHGSQTPDRYYSLQDDVARFRGVESGHKRAEAFLLQLQSPYDIFPLAEDYDLRRGSE
jgi:LmbE family N-acetylglucosaminyl deacetylase